MKRFLTNLSLMLLAAVVVLFIVANRGTVTVSLWPLPYEIDLGLYLIFFIGLFVGMALAWAIGVIKRARSFARARRAEKEAQKLQSEVDNLEQELDAGGSGEEEQTDIPRLPPDIP